MTHITWSIETPDGRCPECNGKTVLITFFSECEVHDDNKEEVAALDGSVMIAEELSGHYCGECHKLTSLSLNT